MAIPKDTLVKIYRDMLRCVAYEEKHLELVEEGETIVGFHGCRGQEALCAVYSQLRPDDYCGYTHRVFYPWLCKGIPTRQLMAEACGKATGTSKGKGGTHISGYEVGVLGRSGMQGAHWALFAGAAIAAQLRGSDQVSVVTAGEGCSTGGGLHEAMNHAAIWKLPVVFVCDNNQYMQCATIAQVWAQPDLHKLAAAYDMVAEVVDGGDALAVAEAAQAAIERGRAGGGPTFLEVKLHRWGTHYTPLEPEGLGYRDFESIQEWKADKDPIANLEAVLLDWGVLSTGDPARIRQQAREEMDDAAAFARESPAPSREEAFTDIYVTAP